MPCVLRLLLRLLGRRWSGGRGAAAAEEGRQGGGEAGRERLRAVALHGGCAGLPTSILATALLPLGRGGNRCALAGEDGPGKGGWGGVRAL